MGGGSEVHKAKMAVMERGQKLNEIEDRTEMMANEAKVGICAFFQTIGVSMSSEI